jgi:hypothetical protein
MKDVGTIRSIATEIFPFETRSSVRISSHLYLACSLPFSDLFPFFALSGAIGSAFGRRSMLEIFFGAQQ